MSLLSSLSGIRIKREFTVKNRLPSGFLALTSLFLVSSILSVSALTQEAQDAARTKRERLKDHAAGFWIYDDIDAGYAKAAKTGKPLLVSFRCVP